ncbi:Heterochromatin protein 1 [Astathelohania contejeani]|uniref:Heterochromatin protein 1 n=1 Tax=Astathelohania contejeani TaxID=164912 RepID=A0ABQ7HWA4_9MICR|nr:Heterochromatin protein 1 [Thelohania contejeani]
MSETDNIYTVEKILKSRKVNGKKQYLIKWEGYDDKHNTWEWETDILSKELIRNFEAGIKKKQRREKTKHTNEEHTSQKEVKTESTKTKKEILYSDAGIGRTLTNEWDDFIKKIVSVHRDNDTDKIMVEVEFTDGRRTVAPVSTLHYKAPLHLLRYYEENLCFSELSDDS